MWRKDSIMKLLFWNTYRNNKINQYLDSLVRDYNIDILITAEYSADENELNTFLEKCHQHLFKCNTYGCDRIDVWSNYAKVEAGIQNRYYSIQVIQKNIILCCVHLVSDSYGDYSNERLAIIQEIVNEIKTKQDDIQSQYVIIMGDINEMPYDKGCLSANGFHGLPALSITDSPTRKVNEKEYSKFYNPMWNLLGDFEYPPGTYYLNKSILHSPMWYMLDQVIISKDLLPLFKKESLKIITSCSFGDLKDKNQHPNKKISDHFPIMCEIDI